MQGGCDANMNSWATRQVSQEPNIAAEGYRTALVCKLRRLATMGSEIIRASRAVREVEFWISIGRRLRDHYDVEEQPMPDRMRELIDKIDVTHPSLRLT